MKVELNYPNWYANKTKLREMVFRKIVSNAMEKFNFKEIDSGTKVDTLISAFSDVYIERRYNLFDLSNSEYALFYESNKNDIEYEIRQNKDEYHRWLSHEMPQSVSDFIVDIVEFSICHAALLGVEYWKLILDKYFLETAGLFHNFIKQTKGNKNGLQ